MRLGQTTQIFTRKTDGKADTAVSDSHWGRGGLGGGRRLVSSELGVDPSLEPWAEFEWERSRQGVKSGE